MLTMAPRHCACITGRTARQVVRYMLSRLVSRIRSHAASSCPASVPSPHPCLLKTSIFATPASCRGQLSELSQQRAFGALGGLLRYRGATKKAFVNYQYTRELTHKVRSYIRSARVPLRWRRKRSWMTSCPARPL
jgi:hypothetical protein